MVASNMLRWLLHCMETDTATLLQRILRPDRQRLAEARAVIAGIGDARHAREALATAGVIGPEWIAHPLRRFCDMRDSASRSRWPTSVAMCLALAVIQNVGALHRMKR